MLPKKLPIGGGGGTMSFEWFAASKWVKKILPLMLENVSSQWGWKLNMHMIGKKMVLIWNIAYKNWWRLARALHFSNRRIQRYIILCTWWRKKCDENEEYAIKATKMREQLNYYWRISSSSNTDYEPSLLRPYFQDPVVEYYNFGHDES